MSTRPSQLMSARMHPVAGGVAVAVGVGVPVGVLVGVAVAVAVLVGVFVGVGDAPRYVASSASQLGLSTIDAWAAYWACAATMQYIPNRDGALPLPTPASAA